jgi:hypothetical protein
MFSYQRYGHLRGAFRKVSALMALGTLVPAVDAALDGKWLRFGLLAGIVAPCYALFALQTSRKGFTRISGTLVERWLMALLMFQFIAMDISELARSKVDYGFLVMHISFIYNFTPLSVSVINILSMVGLSLYLLFKCLRYVDSDILLGASEEEESSSAGKYCIKTTGLADVVIGMLVPLFLLVFQPSLQLEDHTLCA